MSEFVSPANVRAHRDLGRTSYPHMSPADAAVWRRFLAAPPVQFDRLDYDVALGGTEAYGADVAHDYFKMWLQLLKKRVDVVGYLGDERWIIEVKPIATMAALGQVLAYEWLAVEEFGWKGKTRKVIVAGRCDLDLVPVFAAFNVSVWSCARGEGGAVLAPVLAVSPSR